MLSEPNIVEFDVGVFSFLSYRDPNLLKTLDIYDGTGEFLRQLDLDEETLTKSIIGTIGDVDSYQLPDAKGYSRYVEITSYFYRVEILISHYDTKGNKKTIVLSLNMPVDGNN